jgi:hypothetical protein
MEMLVIPFNSAVDKKICNNQKKWRAEEEEKHEASLAK